MVLSQPDAITAWMAAVERNMQHLTARRTLIHLMQLCAWSASCNNSLGLAMDLSASVRPCPPLCWSQSCPRAPGAASAPVPRVACHAPRSMPGVADSLGADALACDEAPKDWLGMQALTQHRSAAAVQAGQG